MLALFQFWRAPEQFGFLDLFMGAGLGVMTWLATLYAVRHPAADEVSAIINGLLSKAGVSLRLSQR
jgi:hypothetical protein